MQIICPDCQFAREVDESKIPARSQVATCPKCQTKFQFRELPPEESEFEIEPKPEATAQEMDAQESPEQADSSLENLAQPAQGTLPFANMPAPAAPEEPVQEAQEVAKETEDEGPVFPPMTAPGENDQKVQHPSGEIWDKLHNMTPPETATKDEEPAVSPFDDIPSESQQPAAGEYQSSVNEPEPVPGWNGQFSEDFPDPMQDEQNKSEDDEHSPSVPPPFEQLDRYGFFYGVYMTIKLVLTAPRLFYSVMPVGGGFSKPLTFTILITMVQTFVQYFWGMAGLSSDLGPEETEQIAGIAGALAPIFMLLLMPAFVAASQFMLTGFYHMLLSLMKAGNKGFEGTFRALAYSNTPIILGLFPMPLQQIEIGWMLIVGIWGLVLTVIGLKNIHKTSYARVIPVAIIPILLAMILGLLALQSGMPSI